MWAARSLAAVSVLAPLALAADFDWSAIEPSEQLKYHPCYDGFQCARLSVPYDLRSSLITHHRVHNGLFPNIECLAD